MTTNRSRANWHIDQKDLLIMMLIYKGGASINEMLSAIRVSSTGTVAGRLDKLEVLGLVEQPKFRKSRSRLLTEDGLNYLASCSMITDEAVEMELKKRGTRIQLPT